MQPQFQSSFIPKGPAATNSAPSTNIPTMGPRPVQRDFFSLLGNIIFTISVLLAMGVFGYKFYLINYIKNSSAALDAAKQQIDPDSVAKIMALNDRIVSTRTIIDNHTVITPIFAFLQNYTPKSTVSFTSMDYIDNNQGITLTLEGKAKDYASLAILSDTITRTTSIRNPVFSDLNLDEKGNVTFKFTGSIEKDLISYRNKIKDANTPGPRTLIDATSTPTASFASSTQTTSTSTKKTATSTR